MRINMPITDVEYILTETDSIVSKTDLMGRITYADEDFIRICGFSREELIGSSHNIIRHPDMPVELFKDLWGSLKMGRPWTGVIKNRCKNGDFYWVLANITPYYENDQLAGYMSVRGKPSPKQVAEATEAYRKFREGKAGHLKIQDGKISPHSLLERFLSLENISIKARLLMDIAIMSILLLSMSAIGLFGMSKDSEGLRAVHKQRMLPSNQLFEVQKQLLTSRLEITASLLKLTSEPVPENIADIEQNIENSTRIWGGYIESELSQEEKKLVNKVASDRKRLVMEGFMPAINALRNNDTTLAKKIIEDSITPLYEPVARGFQQLLQLQVDLTKQEFEASQFRYYRSREIAATLVASGILLTLWLNFSLLRSLVRPLNATIRHFAQIAQGNYHNMIDISGLDELSKVMAALKAMQIKLGFDVAEAKRISDENLRIKIALDNVSTGVMVADNDHNIIYVNNSVVTMFGKAEASIRKQLPNFSATDLIGTNIDDFHKITAHQARMLANTTSIDWGDYFMTVTASPVITMQGKHIGSVEEWMDCTAEVMVEKEIAIILLAAVMGDFMPRIIMEGKTGFYRELSESINQLMQTSGNGVNEAVRIFKALSHGDLTEKITNYYAGTFLCLKDDANTTVDNLNDVICQIQEVAKSIHTAAQEIATGNTSLSHRTEEQAASLSRRWMTAVNWSRKPGKP